LTLPIWCKATVFLRRQRSRSRCDHLFHFALIQFPWSVHWFQSLACIIRFVTVWTCLIRRGGRIPRRCKNQPVGLLPTLVTIDSNCLFPWQQW
jgi:hypothetical protein